MIDFDGVLLAPVDFIASDPAGALAATGQAHTWCFYDDTDELMGQFVQSDTGKFSITFTGTNGDASVSGGAFGFSGGFTTNDSSGVSYTITWRRVW